MHAITPARQVLAQLLSSALYYMADESELTHIIRLKPHEDIGPCVLPHCNALLVRTADGMCPIARVLQPTL